MAERRDIFGDDKVGYRIWEMIRYRVCDAWLGHVRM